MIEIFRHEHRWRIKIVNETFEFENTKDFESAMKILTNLKEKQEPYKKIKEILND